MLAKIEARIKEIMGAIENSASQHNALIGRLNEAQHLLATAQAVVASPNPEAALIGEILPVLEAEVAAG